MKKKLFMLKVLQAFFFILMLAHNILSIFLLFFDYYPQNNSFDNYLIIFFSDYFVNSYVGLLWYLIGIIGSLIVTPMLSQKFKQKYTLTLSLYGMIILTIVCGWWNVKLFISFF